MSTFHYTWSLTKEEQLLQRTEPSVTKLCPLGKSGSLTLGHTHTKKKSLKE